MKLFRTEYIHEPWRNHSQMVRGICQYDVLNPCWDDRPNDVPGQHWGGGKACARCTDAAKAAAEDQS